jgi:asparagine synthase (glutamine-hydrolysing)
MCGIAGMVSAHGCDIDANILADMLAMLEHRGPDDRDIHLEPAAGLAHARLSIIDIGGGAQPMANEDESLWITFNGEIFNYVELREELVARGHRFRSVSDTEVILHLFEERGADAVDQLNGQWAFGLWNAATRTLVLSRDRLGVRPLYYTICGNQLLFASEIKALFAHPGVSREIDPLGLDNVFTFWTTIAPRTIFRNIYELPAGHTLTWRDGYITIDQYWQPSFSTPAAPRPESAYRDELRDRLTSATRMRLRSDVPVGAFVSGGLDSALVATLAQREITQPLHTFSITFDDPEFDERAYQHDLVAALGTVHHEMRCGRDDIARVFPDVVWHTETPLLRTSPAPLYLLSRLVRESGYKVVLTGEGADEVFGGYDIFKEDKVRRFCAASPDSPRRALLVKRLYPYLPNLQRQPAAALRAFFDEGRDDPRNPCYSHLPRWRATSRAKLFFSDAMRAAINCYDGRADIASRLPAGFDAWDPLSRSQYLEMTHLLPGMILSSQGDRVAMAHGVEGRFPFLDRDLISFAAALPPRLKLKVLKEKYLLKEAARELLPASVQRRSKQPYRAPGATAFFSAAATEYVADLLSPDQLRRDGIFDSSAVERLVRKLRTGSASSASDDMALVGIVSTQLLVHRFINHFNAMTHGSSYSGTANVRH